VAFICLTVQVREPGLCTDAYSKGDCKVYTKQ
jgi:hypothetical protein